MYSPKQILKQEPAGIVTALSGLNAAAIGQGLYHLTDVQLGLWYTAALGLLTLFYIRPATVTRDALRELRDARPLRARARGDAGLALLEALVVVLLVFVLAFAGHQAGWW